MMRIGLSQLEIEWEDIDANMKKCEEIIRYAKEKGVELIGFPEFTLVGFTLHPEAFCDKEDSMKQVDFFKEMSVKYDISIVFGYIMEHKPHPLNKLAIVSQGKVLLDYAKLHSYSFGNENNFYDRGESIFTTEIDGMKLGAHICFDLRFPEIFQISARDSDVIFVIGNWPGDRIENWYTLLRARALETQCYIVGVNRAGEGGGVKYIPSSAAYDPAGMRVTEESEDCLVLFDADKSYVEAVRKNFPLKMDRRDALYKSLY